MNPLTATTSLTLARALSTVLLAGLLFAGGCATQRQPSSQLQSAREAFGLIEQNEEIARSAAESLDRSRRALSEAETLLEEGADMERVNHQAYLAQRYAEIAGEEAEQAELQREIEKARQRRQEIRLELEQREALAAQEEAQSAKQRARELQQELASLQAEMTERGVVLTLSDVLFDFDEATLKPGGERVAARLAEFMREYPEHRIRVEGHTDSVGPESYNQELSRRRAAAVKEAVAERGISGSRIETAGYGEQYPVASNDNTAGRQRNRRVEVVISDAQGRIEGR